MRKTSVERKYVPNLNKCPVRGSQKPKRKTRDKCVLSPRSQINIESKINVETQVPDKCVESPVPGPR